MIGLFCIYYLSVNFSNEQIFLEPVLNLGTEKQAVSDAQRQIAPWIRRGAPRPSMNHEGLVRFGGVHKTRFFGHGGCGSSLRSHHGSLPCSVDRRPRTSPKFSLLSRYFHVKEGRATSDEKRGSPAFANFTLPAAATRLPKIRLRSPPPGPGL